MPCLIERLHFMCGSVYGLFFNGPSSLASTQFVSFWWITKDVHIARPLLNGFGGVSGVAALQTHKLQTNKQTIHWTQFDHRD